MLSENGAVTRITVTLDYKCTKLQVVTDILDPNRSKSI